MATPPAPTPSTSDPKVWALLVAVALGPGAGTFAANVASESPAEVARQLAEVREEVKALSVSVRAMELSTAQRTADRFTRSQHDAYADEIDDRLDRLEALHRLE